MREIKMPICTLDEKLRSERKQKYLLELTKYYPALHKLTEEHYFNIKRELEQNNNTEILSTLMGESLYFVLESIADIYAKYDIEDVISIEEGLSHATCVFNERLSRFKTLPMRLSEFKHSTISYIVYLEISRKYNQELERINQIDLMIQHDLTNLIDQEQFETISKFEIMKDEFILVLKKSCAELTIREKEMLSMRLGFKTGQVMTFQEIADEYGFTKGRAHEIIVNAIRKIRENKSTKSLREYSSMNMEL